MFLLAHLTDPHLSPVPRPRWRELAGKRAAGYINWRRRREQIHRGDLLARVVADLKSQRPDHVAVTGDLVNIALPGEFAPARAFLAELGPPHDVTVVPGNHDAYVRGDAAQLHWGDYMRADDASLGFPFLRRRGDIALIGLSSAVPTAPFLATGRLGAAQLARLGELLDECAQAFRVVLIHHPPLSRPARRFKRLIDGAALRAVLARHGAELVLHGHDHERAFLLLAGAGHPIAVAGAPSATEALPGGPDRPGYNLYRIDPKARRCEALVRGIEADGDGAVEIERRLILG